ncbi:spermatogenesis-associated protein 5 [Fopius arisanus]|uniref:SPATA5 protein n=1 Tax=Fopius arisanus TaxID=64838 RepID=A0A0C9RD15_9HYME|nr:PREDICTED: spermatogenesis-associated protein 5 [Fopius arisanus]XP_011303861.1 PREDICTED: spermatogenesis-associated protein 5 [Fopius arisanus]XP_011303862.1 PREDICTED: spermatogenesis-associated protein 5 [Fopius arisanus]
MSSTPRKGSAWVTCANCSAIITQKDTAIHERNCPPSNGCSTHNYILSGTLYSTLDIYTSPEPPKNISDQDTHDMVFMSQSALELCHIAIGDRVVLTSETGVTVKKAWPIYDKSLTTVSLTRTSSEISGIKGRVRVKKINSTPPSAKEVLIQSIGKVSKVKITTDLQILIKNFNERKLFCVGSRIGLPYYGKTLVFKVIKISGNEGIIKTIEEGFEKMRISEKAPLFFEALYNTKWSLIDDEPSIVNQKIGTEIGLKDIGGYEKLIEELKDMLDIIFEKSKPIKGLKINKGILLYGTEGVGKTAITSALLSHYDINVFPLNSSDIVTQSGGKLDTYISEIFSKAKTQAPSVILIEDLDTLCPKKMGGLSENEKRISGILIKEFNELQKSDVATFVWSTTSKIDSINSSLRRPGRIDREFEVPAPTPRMRKDIIYKLLMKFPHSLMEKDIDQIAFVTHGFVGADLDCLCCRAAMNATKRHRNFCDREDDVQVTVEDFNYALTQVKPSAMKEVLVEISNVKWSDIGGQKDLKLKLQQAVEWPLKHPEAFERLGITPPRGLLMFGPPGCSKTMVARALATESKLNFINIKGPELFSKWVGESERAVREVFRKARQVAPSIVFIDEIDALGNERSSGASSPGNQVQERVLAQLLTELDGVTALGNVTLVAATNRPDRIDKALLRPGRLDRMVYVPLPDYETRLEIFKIKCRQMPIDEDVNIPDLVDLTEGYSGAEVQAICHEAAFKALEDDLNASSLSKEHFKAALASVKPRTPRALVEMYEEYVNRIEN